MNQPPHAPIGNQLDRRRFLSNVLAAAAVATPLISALSALPAAEAEINQAAAAPQRKIKIGVVGCGGRGAWIATLFKAHGGYEIWGLADYFQETVDKCGDDLGVDKTRRFTGLSGYQKLIACGIEAIVIIDVPYFYPEQAAAAVAAGLHIYMAKPVAVDVPGCLKIGQLGAAASAKKLTFLVDYQISTAPTIIEVAKRIRAGALGQLVQVSTIGASGTFNDNGFGKLEDILAGLRWLPHTAMGAGYIGNFDIHALDAAVWTLGRRPVRAVGTSQRLRKGPHGDSHDTASLIFTFEDGLSWMHRSGHNNNEDTGLNCRIFGTEGHAVIDYYGPSGIRGGAKAMRAKDDGNLYQEGAKRNIARFHEEVLSGRCDNDTVPRSVDSTLTCILGREAGLRDRPVTMEEILAEKKTLTLDTSSLKV